MSGRVVGEMSRGQNDTGHARHAWGGHVTVEASANGLGGFVGFLAENRKNREWWIEYFAVETDTSYQWNGVVVDIRSTKHQQLRHH